MAYVAQLSPGVCPLHPGVGLHAPLVLLPVALLAGHKRLQLVLIGALEVLGVVILAEAEYAAPASKGELV